MLLLAAAPCADALIAAPTQSQAASVLQLRPTPDVLRVRGGHDHGALQVGVLAMVMLSCAVVSCAAETMMQEHRVSLLEVVQRVSLLAVAVPPATCTLLIANVCVHIDAHLGLLGDDPAERFGFRARDVLMDPAGHWHKLLTGALLHLDHAHIVTNWSNHHGGSLLRWERTGWGPSKWMPSWPCYCQSSESRSSP